MIEDLKCTTRQRETASNATVEGALGSSIRYQCQGSRCQPASSDGEACLVMLADVRTWNGGDWKGSTAAEFTDCMHVIELMLYSLAVTLSLTSVDP